MSFLFGHTKTLFNGPGDIRKARSRFGGWLGTQDPSSFLRGLPLSGEQMDMAPYRDMFTQQRSEALAQAKESVGNLTGSGLGNVVGAAAGRSAFNEGAFLANLVEARRRQQSQLIMSYLSSGVGPDKQQYQPGFLDYAMKGVSLAAPFLGTGGAGIPGAPDTSGFDPSGLSDIKPWTGQ